MRKGKPGIKKQPPTIGQLKEVRIPIKQKTAENINRLNAYVSQKNAELEEAAKDFKNHILPILTEHEDERVLDPRAVIREVTDKAPFELIVMVPT